MVSSELYCTSHCMIPTDIQSYIMDCYFRQSWVDKRLSFEGYKGALALSIEMLRKIWKPDTYGGTPPHCRLLSNS